MNHRILCLAAAAALSPLSSAAVTITVTSDSGASNVAGDCVLRDAITYANTGVPTGGCGAITNAPQDPSPGSIHTAVDPKVIELPAASTITLSAIDDFNHGTGLPAITFPLTIHGNGSTIRRSPDSPCELDGLGTPGEIALLYNDSILELDQLTFEGGCADNANGALGHGGAIANTAQLVLVDVNFSGNQARFSGGALYSSGYGNGAGSVVALRAAFAGNAARDGGAVYLEGSSARLAGTQVLFRQNSANQYFSGGALSAGFGTSVELVDATFAQNSAGSASAVQADGIVTMSFVTIAENTTVSGSGAALQVGATGPLQQLTLRNTLLSGNAGGIGNCQFGVGGVVDAVANLSSDATCTGFGLQSVDARLGAFEDHGGSAATYALLPGSPAVDAVTACTDTHDEPVNFDQRGMPRPQGAACDIGAFELQDELFGNGFEIIIN